MSREKPEWLEPELHAEAIARLREGDRTLADDWLSLVTGRFAAIVRSQSDQSMAAIRDLQASKGEED